MKHGLSVKAGVWRSTETSSCLYIKGFSLSSQCSVGF